MNKNVIYGLNAIREAIQDPSRIQKVFIENGASSPAAQKLMQRNHRKFENNPKRH